MTDKPTYDEFMADLRASPIPHAPYLEPALGVVLGAANAVRLWCIEHGLPLGSAELIAMTRLVLERKEDMHRREHNKGWAGE